MPSTPNYNFPTPPFEGVKPNVPAFMKDLADAVDAKIKELNDVRIAAEAALAAIPAWIPFATGGSGGATMYGASWQDYGGIYAVGAYRVHRSRVWIKGLVRTTIARTTVAQPIVNFPVGARPLKNEIMDACFSGTSTVTSGAASAGTAHTHPWTAVLGSTRVDILPNGDLQCGALSATTLIPANGWISLSGLSFPID